MLNAYFLLFVVAGCLAVDEGSQHTGVQESGRHLAQSVSCRGDLNLDILGKSIGDEPRETSSGPKCCSLCKKQKKCVAWVWQQITSKCFLKAQATLKRSCFGCVSQVLVENGDSLPALMDEIPSDYFDDDDGSGDDAADTQFEPFLVGSRPVPAAEAVKRYPYMVSLRRGTETFSAHHCGGVLISSQTVLTAAHCVDARRFASALPNPLAYIGLAEIDSPADETEIIRTVALATHPSWTGDILSAGNLALLRLERPSTKIPIRLPSSETTFENADVFYALGWGRASDSSSLQRLLQEIVVRKVEKGVCSQVLGRLLPDGTLCAGGEASGTCLGDDGGPLLVRGDSAEEDVLAGIIGAEHACTRLGVPDVYASATFARLWINDCESPDGTAERGVCLP